MFYGIYLPIFLSYIAISVLGLLNLYVFNKDLFIYQLVFFVISIVLYLLFSLLPQQFYKKTAFIVYIINLVLLLMVFILGEITRGSTRWISLGVVNIQPSELIKLTLILVLALVLTNKTKKYLDLKSFLFSLLVFIPSFILVFLQPDLGTSLVLLAIFALLVFYSGVKLSYVATLFLVLALASGPIWTNLKDYQKDRIVSFVNPTLDPLGAGYNALQSQIAIGSGGVFGKGLGAGSQSHLGFLPENTTDFAFAGFSEEWGVFGSLLLISLYFIILFSLLFLFTSVTNYYSRYIILGVMTVFWVHVFINIGMNVGIVPVTGIPLPFFSYGGSAFLALSIMLGLVNSVAKHKQLI